MFIRSDESVRSRVVHVVAVSIFYSDDHMPLCHAGVVLPHSDRSISSLLSSDRMNSGVTW